MALNETERVKFLCDAMLGRLATWLRIIGYDTAYAYKTLPDSQIVEQAIDEGRVLLTRDTLMIERKLLKEHRKYLLVKSNYFREQLCQVIASFDLNTDTQGTICARCNVKLKKTSAKSVSHVVPFFVAATQKEFLRCPQCHRVYWAATHKQKMQEEIEKLFKSVKEVKVQAQQNAIERED